MERKERLEMVIEQLALMGQIDNQRDFALKIGKSKTQVTDMIKGRLAISPKTVNLICTVFDCLNPEWILSGNGEMIKPAPDESMLNMSATFQAQIQLLKEQVAFLEKQLDAVNENNKILTQLLMKK